MIEYNPSICFVPTPNEPNMFTIWISWQYFDATGCHAGGDILKTKVGPIPQADGTDRSICALTADLLDIAYDQVRAHMAREFGTVEDQPRLKAVPPLSS